MSNIRPRNLLLFPLSITAMSLAWLFVVEYMPVSQTEQRNAMRLSRTGPRGQAAYRAVWSDDRLTRADMNKIREEAGHDIDAWLDKEISSR